MSLAGWEVKALRAGKVQLTDSYVLMKNGEAFLLGANITPSTPSQLITCRTPRALASCSYTKRNSRRSTRA